MEWALIGDIAETGIPGRLEWHDGQLRGTPGAVAAVDAFLAENTTVGLSPTGPYIDADRNDPTSVYVIAYRLMRGSELVSGEAPVLPADTTPDGAIT